MTGRAETALIQPDLDIFDPSPGMDKVRKLLVEQTGTTKQLRWLALTVRADNIRQRVKEGAFGSGVISFSVGLAVADWDGIGDKTEDLGAIRCHRHILLVHSPKELPVPAPTLRGIDWLIWSAPAGNAEGIEAAREICRSREVAFLHVDPATAPGIQECAEGPQSGVGNLEGESFCPEHPFGACIRLRRPTLPDLKPPVSFMLDLPSARQRGAGEPCQMPSEGLAAGPVSAVATEMDVLPADNAASLDYGVPGGVPPACDGQSKPVAADECGGDDAVPAETNGAIVATGPLLLPFVIDAGHDEELEEFHRLDEIVAIGLKAGLDAGVALMDIRDRKLWKAAGYQNWNQYCEEVRGLTRQYANEQIKAAATRAMILQVEGIPSTSDTCVPQNVAQIRELYRIKDPEKQARACLLAAERTPGRLTAKSLRDVVAEILAAEDSPPKARKPDRKIQLAQMFQQLRAGIAASLPSDELHGMIDEIEKFIR